jgi:hypothetical protein
VSHSFSISPAEEPRAFSKRLSMLALCWALAVGGGLGALLRYAGTPGAAAAPPSRWPASSRLHRAEARPTLVMLLHPRCPCSRASLRELEKILARAGEVPTTYVLLNQPGDAEAGWADGDLWRAASAIPGVEVLADRGGEEARRFGAVTSGQVLLYGADGVEIFRGGITPARAHEGDNAGERAVLSHLADAGAGAAEAPVFGCPL